MFSKVFLALGLAASTLASPHAHIHHRHHKLAARSIDCTVNTPHLKPAHCEYMAKIGIASTGINALDNSTGAQVWIGDDGPNTFTFHSPGNHSILVFWIQNAGDYAASFVSTRQAAVTVTVPTHHNVTISVSNEVSGAFTFLKQDETVLTQFGQIANTWGEYTTGKDGTIDVSREVCMSGAPMSLKTHTGCVSDMDTCSFQCPAGVDSCETGYILVNCDHNTNPFAASGDYYGAPSGGCQGITNGGHITAVLGDI